MDFLLQNARTEVLSVDTHHHEHLLVLLKQLIRYLLYDINDPKLKNDMASHKRETQSIQNNFETPIKSTPIDPNDRILTGGKLETAEKNLILNKNQIVPTTEVKGIIKRQLSDSKMSNEQSMEEFMLGEPEPTPQINNFEYADHSALNIDRVFVDVIESEFYKASEVHQEFFGKLEILQIIIELLLRYDINMKATIQSLKESSISPILADKNSKDDSEFLRCAYKILALAATNNKNNQLILRSNFEDLFLTQFENRYSGEVLLFIKHFV